MIKFIVISALAITVFALRKKIWKKFNDEYGVFTELICLYGGNFDYYSTDDPAEYRYGNKFWYTKHSKRFQYQTGLKALNSPRQAFYTIYFFTKLFPVKRSGARIISETAMPSDKNGKTGWTWRFDKSPMVYGINPSAQKRIIKKLWSSFEYFMVESWPVNKWFIEIKTKEKELINFFSRYQDATSALEKAQIRSEIDKVRKKFRKEDIEELDDLLRQIDLADTVNADIVKKGWLDKDGSTRYDNPKTTKTIARLNRARRRT